MGEKFNSRLLSNLVAETPRPPCGAWDSILIRGTKIRHGTLGQPEKKKDSTP